VVDLDIDTELMPCGRCRRRVHRLGPIGIGGLEVVLDAAAVGLTGYEAAPEAAGDRGHGHGLEDRLAGQTPAQRHGVEGAAGADGRLDGVGAGAVAAAGHRVVMNRHRLAKRPHGRIAEDVVDREVVFGQGGVIRGGLPQGSIEGRAEGAGGVLGQPGELRALQAVIGLPVGIPAAADVGHCPGRGLQPGLGEAVVELKGAGQAAVTQHDRRVQGVAEAGQAGSAVVVAQPAGLEAVTGVHHQVRAGIDLCCQLSGAAVVAIEPPVLVAIRVDG